jgi:hypothetical protein
MAKDPHWIEHSTENSKGYLHRATHTPAGKDIPAKTVEADTHSKNPHLAAAAREAETLKHLRPH